MSKILDEFMMLVNSRPNYRARGFVNINCPACGDRRKRGGFATTHTGGFRYTCFNGGCTYNERPTGWEPGNGLGGRVRQLFELLGGNIRNIPVAELLKQNRNIYDRRGNVVGREDALEVVTRFPEIDLPRGTDFLEDMAKTSKAAAKVLAYLNSRSPLLLDMHPFMWSPEYPHHLLVPYVHFGERVVGYMGRHISNKKPPGRFIQRAPRDYLFNQHLLSQGMGRYAFVVESPIDAIFIRGVASRENRLTQKQINLLKMCGREPVLIPDMNRGEASPYIQTAEENEWYLSVPDWPTTWPSKDIGESVKRIGLLSTIESITSSMTKNYARERIRLGRKG